MALIDCSLLFVLMSCCNTIYWNKPLGFMAFTWVVQTVPFKRSFLVWKNRLRESHSWCQRKPVSRITNCFSYLSRPTYIKEIHNEEIIKVIIAVLRLSSCEFMLFSPFFYLENPCEKTVFFFSFFSLLSSYLFFWVLHSLGWPQSL